MLSDHHLPRSWLHSVHTENSLCNLWIWWNVKSWNTKLHNNKCAVCHAKFLMRAHCSSNRLKYFKAGDECENDIFPSLGFPVEHGKRNGFFCCSDGMLLTGHLYEIWTRLRKTNTVGPIKKYVDILSVINCSGFQAAPTQSVAFFTSSTSIFSSTNSH